MFTFRSFFVIIIFVQFVTCSKFLVLNKYGWKSVQKVLGLHRTYFLRSTENQNEFIGREAIKLYLQEQSWVLEHNGGNYRYPTSSGSLPLGKNEWSTSTFPSASTLEINVLLCGENQGYRIDDSVNLSPTTKTALPTTAENCFR